MATIPKSENNNCWQGCEETSLVGRTIKWYNGTTTMENKILNPQNIKNRPTMWSSNIYFWVYMQKNRKQGLEEIIYLPVFTATLFTIAKRSELPKCPPMDEWVNKISYIHIMEYYSALRRKEIWHRLQHGWTLRTLCWVK